MAAESSCLSGLYRVQSQGKYPQNSKSKSDTLVTDHDVFLTVGNGSGTQGAWGNNTSRNRTPELHLWLIWNNINQGLQGRIKCFKDTSLGPHNSWGKKQDIQMKFSIIKKLKLCRASVPQILQALKTNAHRDVKHSHQKRCFRGKTCNKKQWGTVDKDLCRFLSDLKDTVEKRIEKIGEYITMGQKDLEMVWGIRK